VKGIGSSGRCSAPVGPGSSGRGSVPPGPRFCFAPLLVVAAAACSGQPHEQHPVARNDARGPTDAAPTGDAGGAKTGDVQVRVELPDVSVAARASPGRTACGTAKSAAVAPTTTWGIPDALVIVEGAAAAPSTAKLVVADCTVSPKLVVGTALAITSAADRPAKLVLTKRGSLDHLEAGEPVTILAPIAGHTVTAQLDANAVYSLATEAKDPEVAWIATVPNAVVTDEKGQAMVRDLSSGPHSITAWYPPRGSEPALRGTGSVTAVRTELVEITVVLKK